MPTHPEFPGMRIYERTKSPYFYLEYPCPISGKTRRESSGKTTEDEAWDELRCRLRRAVEVSWKAAVVHFFEVRSDLKSTTLHQYQNSVRALDSHLGNLLLSDIDVETLKSFVDARRKQVKDNSVRRDLATGSTIFSNAQLSMPGKVPENNPFKNLPKRHLKESKRTRYLSPEEYDRIEAAMNLELHRVLLEVFVFTGMRHQEVCNFKIDWINWNSGIFGEISLPREMTKNNEPRIIPLFPSLRNTLEDWCARAPCEYVFSHYSELENAHVKYISFSSWWRRARDRAGVKDVRIHDLRHTFASWWAQKGGSMAALKEMLGHADLRMVDRYAHLNSEAQHRAMQEVLMKE